MVSLVILGLALFVSAYTYRMSLDQISQDLKQQVHSVRKMLDTTHEISVGLTDKVATLFVSQFTEPFTLVADRPVQVGALEALARRWNVSGVPTFVFDRRHAFSGAQPLDVFLQVFDALRRPAGATAH